MKIKISKILIIFSLLLILTGCWDSVELEEQGFVVVIGVDKTEGNDYYITYQIANPQGGGFQARGMSQKEPPAEIITLRAPGIHAPRDLALSVQSRRINFSHVTTIIASEELARNGRFLRLIEAAIRDGEIKRQTNIIITKGKAYEFIRNNNPELETRPHKFYDLITRSWQETGIVPISNIYKFITRTEGDASLYLAVYADDKKESSNPQGQEDNYYPGQIDVMATNKVQFIGAAVFRDGVMVGSLTGEENREAYLLREDFKTEAIEATYPDPYDKNYRITTLIKKPNKAKVDIDISGKYPKISESIELQLKIESIPSGVNYITDLDKQNELERFIENNINEKVKRLIIKTQGELKGEPFLWSSEARKKFLTWEDYAKYDWMKKYPHADVDVKVKVKIVEFGKQLGTTNYSKISD